MQLRMEDTGSWDTGRIQQFLAGNEEVEFRGQNQQEKYAWIERTLAEQEYAGKSRKEKGAIRALLCKMSGLSIPQVTRLIRRQREHGRIARQPTGATASPPSSPPPTSRCWPKWIAPTSA